MMGGLAELSHCRFRKNKEGISPLRDETPSCRYCPELQLLDVLGRRPFLAFFHVKGYPVAFR